MERVTVTFDLIFDLRRRHASLISPRHTTFSFMANGVTYHDLSVSGWPMLQVGQTVTALLRKEGHWRSLVGWVNHDNGEIVKPTAGRTLRRAGWLTVGGGVLVALLHMLLTVDAAGSVARGAHLVFLLLWAGYGAFLLALVVAVRLRSKRRRADEQALESCLKAINRSRVSQPPLVAVPERPARRPVAKNY